MSEFPSVKRPQDEIEPQEVILDRIAQESATEELRERKLEVPLPRRVLYVIFGVFVSLSVLFLLKSVNLQIFAAKQWSVLAKQNVMREIPIIPERGVIYDKNFVQLAFNQPSFDFVCDKRDMPSSISQRETVIRDIATLLSIDFNDLKKQFDETNDPQILISSDLSHDNLILLKTKDNDLPGCVVQEDEKRSYPVGEIFSHLIGYTSKISKDEKSYKTGYSVVDQIGKSGVEKSYEDILRGEPGKLIVEKNAVGKTVAQWQESAAKAGLSLVLWLDSGLQKKIVESLENVFRETGSQKAAAVALDPNTGGVFALVSLPGFDNNMFSRGVTQKQWEDFLANPSNPLFNRAISGVGYPTGSVIKPLLGSAALQEGVITERTTLFAPAELCVPNKFTGGQDCFHDWTFHGWSDIRRAIAESVNPFFYIIGGGYDNFQGLGAGRIKRYLELFGWGRKTGIDLPSEGEGVLPILDENWRLGDTYHLSIGQGSFAVTPLQVTTAISAIANGGRLLEPRAVQRVIDNSKNTLETIKPSVLRERFIDQKNLKIIQEGMRQTVTAGSATGWLDRLPVAVAAKTGTAQTGKKTVDGKDYLYSWTVAFAPYEKPQIVLVVVVEDIREGQVAALPVVRDVLQWYFSK